MVDNCQHSSHEPIKPCSRKQVSVEGRQNPASADTGLFAGTRSRGGTGMYALGPAAFQAALTNLGRPDYSAITDSAGFSIPEPKRCSRAIAHSRDDAVLLLIEYPTPQLAGLHWKHLRTGPSSHPQSQMALHRAQRLLLAIVPSPSSPGYATRVRERRQLRNTGHLERAVAHHHRSAHHLRPRQNHHGHRRLHAGRHRLRRGFRRRPRADEELSSPAKSSTAPNKWTCCNWASPANASIPATSTKSASTATSNFRSNEDFSCGV